MITLALDDQKKEAAETDFCPAPSRLEEVRCDREIMWWYEQKRKLLHLTYLCTNEFFRGMHLVNLPHSHFAIRRSETRNLLRIS